jgi:hypothetical protein
MYFGGGWKKIGAWEIPCAIFIFCHPGESRDPGFSFCHFEPAAAGEKSLVFPFKLRKCREISLATLEMTEMLDPGFRRDDRMKNSH